VLVVEDDDKVRRVTVLMLRKKGYHVLAAASAAQALQIAREQANDIQLLLTDVVMPEVSGPELAEQMLQINPAIRVLYASGYPRNFIKKHDLTAANIDFIAKPFTLQSLTKTVGRILAG
jgi:DNA-binding NtrC family response regulator